MISYIVSAFDRPIQLIGCLSSLMSQTHQDFEIIITDNASDAFAFKENQLAVMGLRKHSFVGSIRYLYTAMETCYHSAEHAALSCATGEWLCFPSDDSYYVPDFAKFMLEKAGAADLVYCDCIYDPRRGTKYEIMDTKPLIGHIDKTNFIVRKEWFDKVGGFPDKKPGGCSDGLFIEKAVQMGARHVKADGVLCFHN